MLKKYLWIKNLVFVILVSFLAAQILNRIALTSFMPDAESAGKPGITSGRTKPKSARKKVLRDYGVISDRNIFNSEYTGDEVTGKTDKTASTSVPLKKADLNVKLIGTVVSTPEASFAIVLDQKSNEQELYQIHDMIQDEARVLKISRCKVVVLREGAEEILECPDEETPESRSSSRVSYRQSTPSSGNTDTVRKVSDTEYLIDETEVENAMENINQLITQIRVVPNFQDGKANGFKVFAIKPNSIFSKIGLKNGDVIQSVNDRNINSPDKAFAAFQDLKSEKSLAVEILRRGSKKSLHYEIR